MPFSSFFFIEPIDAAQYAHQNALKTNAVAIKLMKLGQLEDAGCAGIESAKALAVTGGGYKRRLQTAVASFRNRNETKTTQGGSGLGCGAMACAQRSTQANLM